jgi:O-antigen ligase/thioredoxin-like negative regulator of GroEL
MSSSSRQRTRQARQAQADNAPSSASSRFHEERLARLLGALAGVLLAALWWLPSNVYPLQSLGLCLAFLAMGAALAATAAVAEAGRRPGRSWRARLAALVPVPATRLALAAVSAWALARWRLAPVHALGRDWVVGLCWMAALAPAGAALARHGEGAAGAGFRRAMAAMAILLGFLAFWQYTFGYRQAEQALRATLSGPVRDLETQSLLHVLNERRVAGRLGNPNLFAAQLAMLAVFAVGTLGEPRRRWQALGAAGWLAAAGALALTGSRGGALTFAVATTLAALTLWMGRSHRPRGETQDARATTGSTTTACLMATLVGAAALLASATARATAGATGRGVAGGWLERLSRVDTIRERLFYWSIALKIWARHPIVGAGPGGFERLYPLYKSPLAHESQYAHSWVFQYGAELGIVGLALIGVVWAGVAWGWWRSARRAGTPRADAPAFANDPALDAAREARWPLLAVAMLGLNGLVEFSLQWRVFLVAIGALAGLGCGLWKAANPGAIAAKPARQRWRAAMASLFCALTGVALAGAFVVGVPYDLAAAAAWQGRLAQDAHDLDDAIAAHEEALRWEPDDSREMVALAGCLTTAGRSQEAWDFLLRAQATNPDSASTRAAQASWLDRAGRRQEALAKQSEAVAIYPTKVDYRLDRARLALDLGRAEAARADLEAIERGGWPVWEFQREPYNALRRRAGLAPAAFDHALK